MDDEDLPHPVTAEAVEEIRRAMEEQGVSQRWVVKQAQITDAALSDILRRKVKSSKYLVLVLRALQIPLYRVSGLDDNDVAILEAMRAILLSAGERRASEVRGELLHRLKAERALIEQDQGASEDDRD